MIADCFGTNRCHLICITQEIRYHRTGQPINQKVWKPEIHTNCSSPFVVFNYKASLIPALFAVVSTFKSKKSIIKFQEILDTQHIYPVSSHTDSSCARVVIVVSAGPFHCLHGLWLLLSLLHKSLKDSS